MRTLHIPDDATARLRHYLDAPHERMAFMLALPDGDGDWTVIGERYLDDERDYDYQGPFGMELADHVRPELIQWAHAEGAAIVEAHAHLLPPPTGFSPTDLRGLADAVPQLLWRLPGRPYTALVFGAADVDALTWHAADEPQLPHSVTLGRTPFAPTGIGVTQLHNQTRRTREVTR